MERSVYIPYFMMMMMMITMTMTTTTTMMMMMMMMMKSLPKTYMHIFVIIVLHYRLLC
jgi:hypothetical protein